MKVLPKEEPAFGSKWSDLIIIFGKVNHTHRISKEVHIEIEFLSDLKFIKQNNYPNILIWKLKTYEPLRTSIKCEVRKIVFYISWKEDLEKFSSSFEKLILISSLRHVYVNVLHEYFLSKYEKFCFERLQNLLYWSEYCPVILFIKQVFIASMRVQKSEYIKRSFKDDLRCVYLRYSNQESISYFQVQIFWNDYLERSFKWICGIWIN